MTILKDKLSIIGKRMALVSDGDGGCLGNVSHPEIANGSGGGGGAGGVVGFGISELANCADGAGGDGSCRILVLNLRLSLSTTAC